MTNDLTEQELKTLKQIQEKLQKRIMLYEMKRDVEINKNKNIDLESKYKAFN